jgi:hypothetical protein
MEMPWKVKEYIENRKRILSQDLFEFDRKIKEAKLLIRDIEEEKSRTIEEISELIKFKKEVEK